MKYLAILIVAAGMFAFHPRYAFNSYVNIKGQKQGVFKGEAVGRGGREKEGWFQISSFGLGDVNTGNAGTKGGGNGRSQAKPIIVKKEIDGATPKLQIAFNGAELLEVQIQTIDANNKVTGTTTLKNAKLSAYKLTGNLEELTLVYESLEYAAN
jgi:type VI secretion system Hcp family effector